MRSRSRLRRRGGGRVARPPRACVSGQDPESDQDRGDSLVLPEPSAQPLDPGGLDVPEPGLAAVLGPKGHRPGGELLLQGPILSQQSDVLLDKLSAKLGGGPPAAAGGGGGGEGSGVEEGRGVGGVVLARGGVRGVAAVGVAAAARGVALLDGAKDASGDVAAAGTGGEGRPVLSALGNTGEAPGDGLAGGSFGNAARVCAGDLGAGGGRVGDALAGGRHSGTVGVRHGATLVPRFSAAVGRADGRTVVWVGPATAHSLGNAGFLLGAHRAAAAAWLGRRRCVGAEAVSVVVVLVRG